ncbi:uncharacterized protein LOC133559382 isoform X2 [Nerophis ophidion]|uniref:uncharacterized protein LOC133559382 isoform X2 n=1 Tax=Nerophis ophidion TaxID=159077 RepID=UPI002ADFD2A6|nr:uncharacterized protein LOC133559382 isoform X2 [Nerophis ophidion]
MCKLFMTGYVKYNLLKQKLGVKLMHARHSRFIVNRAEKWLEGDIEDDEESWPGFGSCLGSESSKSRSISQRSKSSSGQSRSKIIKRMEAEAAASQEILAVKDEQEKEKAELQNLERENFARQQAMEEWRRKIDRLEEVTKMNAAKDRLKIYDEVESTAESQSLSHSIKAASETQAIPITPSIPFQAINTTQVFHATSHAFAPHIQQTPIIQAKATSQTLKASSPPFIPQATQVKTVVTQPQANSDLVGILAETISANRLPTPEPALFTGDPLKFKDWQLSFETLIERKNIHKNEKLYYLRKYLGGSAKRAVEGFLLVGTDEAYDSAWKLLEKRFGDLFTIGKCFRDKLHG